MSLYTLFKAYSPFLTLAAAIFGPSLLPRFLSLLNRKQQPRASRAPRAPTPIYLKIILLLHTVYQTYECLTPPYDLFTSNNLPILTSNERLRTATSRHITSSTLHPSIASSIHPLIDLLLQRLHSLDNRYLYARFGHRPLLSCVWCTSKSDFLLAALPGTLGVYVLQAGLLGVTGWGSVGGRDAGRRGERWRSVFGWGLGVVGVGEGLIKYFWDVRAVEGDCLHLSTTIHTIRSIIFLLLPILYNLAPLPAPSPYPTDILPSLQATQQILRLTSLSRTAISRDPSLRKAWSTSGEETARQAMVGREDEDVKRIMGEVGMSEEGLRKGAGEFVRGGWRGLVRVEVGHPPPKGETG